MIELRIIDTVALPPPIAELKVDDVLLVIVLPLTTTRPENKLIAPLLSVQLVETLLPVIVLFIMFIVTSLLESMAPPMLEHPGCMPSLPPILFESVLFRTVIGP